MTNKELIEILHNIPQEIFQSKNHEKLRLVFSCRIPRIKLLTSYDYEILILTLYDSMDYAIWSPRTFEDIKNQVKSYLNILGFAEILPNLSSSAYYPPNIGVAINSSMTNTEIMKLIQLELQK